MYIEQLDEIVNKDNNTYHRTIKMKPTDVNPSMYSDIIRNKSNKKEVEKIIKRKGNKLYDIWKGWDSQLDWQKRHNINEWTFPESKSLVGRVKVKSDLSNYVIKAYFKKVAGADTSGFAKKNWFS